MKRNRRIIVRATGWLAVVAAAAWLGPAGCSRPAPTADADVLAVLGEPRTDADQTAMIDLGRRTYLRNSCHNCHALDGKVGNGAPQLRNLYTTPAQLTDGTTRDRDRAYLVGSILRPNDHVVAGHAQQMTSGYRFLPADEVAAMIVYLEQFSPPSGVASRPQSPPTPPSDLSTEPDSPINAGP